MSQVQTGDQAAAPQQSLESRIAAKFGFPPDEEIAAPKPPDDKTGDEPVEMTGEEPESQDDEAAEAAPPADEFEEIEFEGERLQIPKSLSKVKEGLLRQADYTKKTQEIAEQRKALETVLEAQKTARLAEAFQQETAKEREMLTILDAAIAQAAQLNWSEMPMEQAFRTKMELDKYKEQRAALADSLKSKEQEFFTKAEQSFRQIREQVREQISKSLNGYDEKVLAEWAQGEGLTSQELEGVLADPRSARIAWKARQYDVLQAQKSAATEKAKAAPPVIKPSSTRPMPDAVKEKLNFRKQLSKVSDPVQRAKLHEQRLAKLFGA